MENYKTFGDPYSLVTLDYINIVLTVSSLYIDLALEIMAFGHSVWQSSSTQVQRSFQINVEVKASIVCDRAAWIFCLKEKVYS